MGGSAKISYLPSSGVYLTGFLVGMHGTAFVFVYQDGDLQEPTGKKNKRAALWVPLFTTDSWVIGGC